jgi:hypothetical protein
VEVDYARAGLADAPRHAGADRRGAEPEARGEARDAHAVDCLFASRGVARSHQRVRLEARREAFAEVAQVRLHPALVRRVELPDVQHAN